MASVHRARVLGLWWLAAASAWASSAVQMDVPALTRAATDVVRVRVASSRSAWTDDHRRIVTFVELDVLERWKGPAAARLTLLQPGGERDGFGQAVAGVARLSAGEELVLFLERQGPLCRVVGLSQGVYRVERPSVGGASAVPVAADGLTLIRPAGDALAPRTVLPLESLQVLVRQEVRRE